jgi:hypothetical protein
MTDLTDSDIVNVIKAERAAERAAERERCAKIADAAAKGALTVKGVNLHHGTAAAIAERIRQQ